ncbi:hypothetical protein B9479_008346, partial [Cryptococcus floricola]
MSNYLTATDADPIAAYDWDDLSDYEQTETPATPTRRSPRGHQRSSDVSGELTDYTSFVRNHKTYRTLGQESQEQVKKFGQLDLRRQLIEHHIMMVAFIERDEGRKRAEEAVELVPTYVDEVMACPILPTYKDKRLHKCIADLMERFNPGTIPAVGSTDYNVVLKAIGKRLTTQRFNVLNEIKGSVDKGTNLFCLAKKIMPEGNQRTIMVLGRVAMLRGLAQDFDAQGTIAA